jgi:hypothetical protein
MGIACGRTRSSNIARLLEAGVVGLAGREGEGLMELTLDPCSVLGSHEPGDRMVHESFVPFEFSGLFSRDGDLFSHGLGLRNVRSDTHEPPCGNHGTQSSPIGITDSVSRILPPRTLLACGDSWLSDPRLWC